MRHLFSFLLIGFLFYMAGVYWPGPGAAIRAKVGV